MTVPRPPEGLRLLGLGAALFGCLMLYVTSAVDRPEVGGTAGLLGTLALVAAEALWNGRSWAFRASALLAGVYCVVLLVSPWLDVEAPLGLIAAVLSAAPIIPALRYIRRQVAALARAPSPARIAVPGRTP